MHYHLEPIGGVAGDMFAAAMLDFHTDWYDALSNAIRDSGLISGLGIRALQHNDGVLTGHRFEVSEPTNLETQPHHAWRDIRARLRDCDLDDAVKERATAIFELLAKAEAEVHASSVDEVAFHEVGAWDSVGDIVAAAWLIERSAAESWSCSPIPLGQGEVNSAHGLLPVPAPATERLLRGFPMFDDGVEGERITPTGAAILKHLNPSFSARRAPSVLVGCGYGFGTKTFREFSNVLRMSVFDPQRSHSADNDIAVCQFEVDDQTPEDLAIGLERLRELPNVLDVLQLPVFSKKGRLATHVQVLGQLSQIDAIIECCFVETTTLGVRWHSVKRTTLERERRSYTLTDNDVRVKRAWRPDGRLTRKVEMADLAGASGGHAGREQLRREAHCRDIEDDGEPKLNPRSGQ